MSASQGKAESKMTALKKLLCLWLLATVSVPAQAATDTQLLAWVEARYPYYFRGAATSGQNQQYNYRYYPATGNYLGVDALGNVYAAGKDFGSTPRTFLNMQSVEDAITAAQAQQSPMNTRNVVTLSGRVTDKAGDPVPGVSVEAFHHNDHITLTTTTDANGAWAIAGMDSTNSHYTSDYALYAEKAGFAIASAGSGAGKVTRMDFNGYYRTVTRFFPMPLQNTAGIDFIASRAGDKYTSLPRTGQQTSYAPGDDAANAAGVAWPTTRFTNNNDGTVTDNLTGLLWLKDAGCLGTALWDSALIAANRLGHGTCGLSDGSTAGDWRLPNVNELESLVDIGQSMPALSAGHPFTGVADVYWSSTTYSAAPSLAMAIRLSDGRWINGATDGGNDNKKTASTNSVWAVKSGGTGKVQVLATGVYNGIGGRSFGRGDDASLQSGLRWTTQRFIDNGDGTLSDTVTGLVWLKKADCIRADWTGALAAVDKLATGQCGLSDGSGAGQWRLPNRAEMLSISDRAPTFPQANYFNGIPGPDGVNVTSPVIFEHFVQAYYWTSSTRAGDPTQAWSIYSCDFGAYNQLKTDTQHYALAVRQQ
jgi:hypothetical protein